MTSIIIALIALVLANLVHRFYFARIWSQMTREDGDVRFPAP